MPTTSAPVMMMGGAGAPPSIAAGSGGSGLAASAGAGGMGVPTAGSSAVVPPMAGSAAPMGGSAASMGGSGGSMGGSGGSMAEPMACMKHAVKASEVIFIGESFIALSGAIPRFTSQLARDAGTIGASESYRSYAVSGTLLTSGEIPGQYTRAVSEGPVKVVLMDGGGNDLLVGGRCQSGFDASCKEIVSVVQTLFGKMKGDGVTDVVYFFYPDPMGIGANIKNAMDILRPEMKKACDGATDVRCVWVDQRESWEGKYSMFTSDGIHPTDAGAMASAKQIWDAMVASCIAQ